MTNRYIIKETVDTCAFCGAGAEDVTHIFVGVTGNCICNNCVQYVREDMGLTEPKTKLEEAIDKYV